MAKKQTKQDTQADIETAEDGGVIGTGNDARLKMMAEINARNDKQLADSGDLADVNDDGTTSRFEMSEDDTQEKTDEEIIEEETARAEQEANQRAEPDDESESDESEQTEPVVKHKIKVNGKELELTTQELIERAQKVEAADEYLDQAARKLRETNQKEIPASQQPSAEDVAAKALEEERRIVRAIQMGSEEEAMAALRQIRGQNNPSLKEDDVTRLVEQRMAFNDAYTKFQTQFPDIVSDPILWDVATRMDAELMRSGDSRTYWARYEEIGKQIRSWRESIVKSSGTNKETFAEKPSGEKQQRKASASTVPKAASVKAPAAVDDEDREESPSEIIAAMAKARGGPQWLRG